MAEVAAVALFIGTVALAGPDDAAAAAHAAANGACKNAPGNGQVLADHAGWTERANRLEIQNGSRGDAIIKIRDAATGKMLVSFLVKSNASAAYDLIPDGSYRFQYAFGDRLNSECTTFLHYAGAGEFPNSEQLVTGTTGEKIVHRALSFTLYPIPSGTVRPRSIDAATFDAP